MRLVDRVAYINHDIDDAIRFGILERGRPSRRGDRAARAAGSRRIDTLVHDLVETSERAGDIAQSDEIGAAMLSLRAFMFEHVYLGPRSAEEHERAHATSCAGSSTTWWRAATASTRSSTSSPA